jgi:cullin-associated NEDD8-dissociated protein 1
MLVPMNCNLYNEYLQVRADVALQPSQLHEIQTDGQACAQFGIHHRLPFLKELYDRRKASFVSNVGALVEPTTKEQFEDRTASTCVGLFSHSDQRTAAQTLKCQVAGTSPKGAGGRFADALAAQDFRTTSFSVAGTAAWSQGVETNTDIIDRRQGSVRFNKYQQLQTVIGNITSTQYSNIYAEEYAQQLSQSLDSSERLASTLENLRLNTSESYRTESGLAKQFHQVARLIAARDVRKAERDFFFVSLGGFDAHSEVLESLELKFQEINDALQDFVTELEAQDVFDSTVLVTASDFGRSLTSNGAGTDHAWAGNYFVLGGGVNGGHVLNDFPTSLLEGNQQDAGRGRLIPKYPWESMMVPIAEWMGVEESRFGEAFPNLANFNRSAEIIDRSVLFRS